MQNVHLTLKIGLFIMNLYKRDTSNGIIRVTGRKSDYGIFDARIFDFRIVFCGIRCVGRKY